MTRVQNLRSNTGKAVANQFAITTDSEVVFQSYNSVIARIDRKTHRVTLGRDWDFSKTTTRWLFEFLRGTLPTDDLAELGGLTSANIRRAIRNGVIAYNENMR